MNQYISNDLVEYVGGNSEIVEKSTCNIFLYKDKVIIKIKNNNKKVNLKIPFDKIITIETKTQEQISREVTFGRLLVLGVFALAFKKEKSNTKYYIIIRYNDVNNKEQHIVYTKLKNLQRHYNLLKNLYDDYKKNKSEKLPYSEDLIIDSRYSTFKDYIITGNYAKAEDILYVILDDLRNSNDNDYNIIKKDGIEFYVNLLPKSDEELIHGNLPRKEVLDGLNYLQTKY